MSDDTREVLGLEASKLLRRAARFEEIRDSTPDVIELAELGLLALRFADRPEEGYIITANGSDAVHGAGRFRLTKDDDPFGNASAAANHS